VLSALDAGNKGNQMNDETITVTLSKAEADWLADHLAEWWQGAFSGIDEIDYFLPLLTTYKALINAGAAPYKNEPVKVVSE
jgi:hypothetical protein